MESAGGPLPSPALVKAVCNGAEQRETYTDAKGAFWIDLGDGGSGSDSKMPLGDDISEGPPLGVKRTAGFPSMSNGGFAGNQPLRNCEVEATIPGYRSDPIRVGGSDLTFKRKIGPIVVHRVGPAEGRVVSITSLVAPKGARKLYEKGLEDLRHRRAEAALKQFAAAVRAYPEYAAAWGEIAGLQAEAGDAEAARRAIENALRADSHYLPPYVTLAQLEVAAKKWEAADDATGKLIRLDPFDYPQAYLMKAMAKYNLGDRDSAQKNLREAQKADIKHSYPQTWNLSGIILAEQGNYEGAAAELKEYLRLTPAGPNADLARARLYEYERKLTKAQPE
jgi:outer membrane protein assembly factor BamD (BamD/ComL family)